MGRLGQVSCGLMIGAWLGLAAAQQTEHPEFRDNGGVAPATGTITFRFEDARLQPARYVITLHSDGRGHFESKVGSAPPDDIANLPAVHQSREIAVSDAARKKLFAIAARERYFAGKCEGGGNKVAFQGKKTVGFQGPEGHGECTYNYGVDTGLQWLTGEMVGLAATLEEGRRLAVQHEHGRLMLDAELETLETMVKDGQATELENIAPTLQSIVSDEAVMTRARRRAQALLDAIPADSH